MKYAYIIIWVLILSSCSSAPYYSGTHTTKDGVWSYDDVASFSFDIPSTDTRYDLVAELEHTTSFSYENLYVNMHTHFPNGEVISDQVSLPFANAFGQWHGDCSDDQCRLSIVLQSRIRFKEIGNHKIDIEQYSRQDSLPNITAISLALYELSE